MKRRHCGTELKLPLVDLCLCTILRAWISPFEKGGQGGFVVGVNMKIPLGPHFSKGEVM